MTSSRVLCTTTSPMVIFGGFGSAFSSFHSRTQLDAMLRRLVGLRRRLEEADGGHDAVAGIDEVIAAEARQLAQAWGTRRVLDLLDELAGAALVDRLIAPNGAVHVSSQLSPQDGDTRLSPPRCASGPEVTSRGACSARRRRWGLLDARRNLADFLKTYLRCYVPLRYHCIMLRCARSRSPCRMSLIASSARC